MNDVEAYRSEFDIIHLKPDDVERHNRKKHGNALLWDRRVWQRFFWKMTDWTQQQVFDALKELLLLARSDAFIGKFSSNLFRAAMSLRSAQCDCAPAFISLDAPWCFDYGLRQGRNWEFPLVNQTTGREQTDVLFEC
uniref:Uncharacterized protein n=1 Tax=Haptolina brevifila TaxID=156173 RepID=A0A7S2HSA3_9EUKA